MNYYILTSEQFDLVDKSQVSYVHYSLDKSKLIVRTEEEVAERYRKFRTKETCSNFTFNNHQDWVGDNTGVEEWEFEDILYFQEL